MYRYSINVRAVHADINHLNTTSKFTQLLNMRSCLVHNPIVFFRFSSLTLNNLVLMSCYCFLLQYVRRKLLLRLISFLLVLLESRIQPLELNNVRSSSLSNILFSGLLYAAECNYIHYTNCTNFLIYYCAAFRATTFAGLQRFSKGKSQILNTLTLF